MLALCRPASLREDYLKSLRTLKPATAGFNRFKGTFSVEVGDGFNTPSGCVIANAVQILNDT